LGSKHTTIVWYRNDLRTDDHAPLVYASRRGNVVPVYILEEDDTSINPIGGASRWWLNRSLKSLSATLENLGSPLVIRSGSPEKVLWDLCSQYNADQISMHDSIEPHAIESDDQLDHVLDCAGIELVRFATNLLWSVGSILNNSAKPYQVFTHFWKRGSGFTAVELPIAAPIEICPPKLNPDQIPLENIKLPTDPDWAVGLNERWTPGEPNANESLNHFLLNQVGRYHEDRDLLAHPGWSALSAPLHYGEISVRRIWHTLTEKSNLEQSSGTSSFLRQLGWRDFAAHLLNHFPHTVDNPLREQFEQFPWRENPDHLEKWKRGMTGYPVVDAAMRNLWREGWMPNRARMIVASFLCKDLLISWTEGATWFWETLVDADLANNTMGWQWVAGCGADASPFFRIFNPMSQGKKFDPQGEYVRRWVPELAQLSNKDIHSPWLASRDSLSNAGVVLGKNYPHPIVDHALARVEALEAYSSIKK